MQEVMDVNNLISRVGYRAEIVRISQDVINQTLDWCRVHPDAAIDLLDLEDFEISSCHFVPQHPWVKEKRFWGDVLGLTYHMAAAQVADEPYLQNLVYSAILQDVLRFIEAMRHHVKAHVLKQLSRGTDTELARAWEMIVAEVIKPSQVRKPHREKS